MPPIPAIPGPWPPVFHPAPVPGAFDPPGPLAALVVAPVVGALLTVLLSGRWGRAAARVAALWTVPGALFLLAAAWFAAGAGATGAGAAGELMWLERLPGHAGLALTRWNLVPALALGLAAPLALALPEPREVEPAHAAGLLLFTASTHAAILAAGPGLAALGWMGGAWSLFVLLGHADAAGQGEAAIGPFVAHALAATFVFVAGLAPPLAGALVFAAVVRLGLPPFHNLLARAYELLPTGAVLLFGVGFVASGLVAMANGIALVGQTGRDALVPMALGFAGAAAWGGLVALPQDDVKRRLAGFVTTQGAVWAALLAAAETPAERAWIGRWAVVFLLAFAALVVTSARLWAFTRTSDLRAYGGLGRSAIVRSGLLLVTIFALVAAPLLAGGLETVSVFGAVMARAPLVGLGAAVGGALATLGVGLAVYRTVRGASPGPVPPPDLGGRDWLLVGALFVVLVVLGGLAVPGGALSSLWPVPAGAGS